MLNRLNNTNGKGSSAVVNKQIKDLQNDVSQLQTDVAQGQTDIGNINTALASKVSKSELAAEVDTASLEAVNTKIDFIESKDEAEITINDNVKAKDIDALKGSFTCVEVNGVDIVNDYTCKVSCALTDSAAAVCTANDALTCAQAVECSLNDYKDDIAAKVTTVEADIECARVSCSIETPALTVTSCAEIQNMTAQTIKAKAELMNAFIEPTEKDETDFYLFHLPPKFQGRAHFIGVDEDDNILFSATIDTSFSDRAGSPLGDREGTGILVHSGVTKWDFYQLLRRKDQDRLAFITQSNIKTLYYKYDNYDKTEEPIYDIYPNLTDQGPDYTLYDTIYTAEHSDQVVVYGSEQTLNGGLTVYGTFYATAFEVPETEVANVRVKQNIYGGYDCDTGEFSTCGTRGGLITFSACPGLPEEVVTWVNGCPRQVVRKGVCECSDGYGNECSQLCFEDVIHSATEFKPASNTDCLFDETSLSNYAGETCDGCYPIKHLNCDSCVHGNIEVECDIKVCGKVVTNCIESDTGCDLGITAKKDLNVSAVCDATLSAVNVTNTITGNKAETVCGTLDNHVVGNVTECYEGSLVEVHDDAVDKRYACGKSETLSAGDYIVCAQGGSIAVTACCDIGFTSDTHNIQANETHITCQTYIDKLDVCEVTSTLNVDGDIKTKGSAQVEKDLHVKGDMYVDGGVHAVSMTEVNTSGNYVVTRDKNNTPLSSAEYSGLAVNNYASGCIATLTADCNGEWRVSDSATGTGHTYTDISHFGSDWYTALTQTTITAPVGIFTNTDSLELADTVYDSGYYHFDGANWFGPITVVSGQFDVGSIVTDAAKITALEALTKNTLLYYNSLTTKEIDPSTNQPLLTREEKADLQNNDLLAWDCANSKATNVTRPVQNNTVLTAQIDSLTNCVSYCWKSGGSGAICCYATRACANAAILIAEGCDGYVPDNAQIIIEDEVNYITGEER